MIKKHKKQMKAEPPKPLNYLQAESVLDRIAYVPECEFAVADADGSLSAVDDDGTVQCVYHGPVLLMRYPVTDVFTGERIKLTATATPDLTNEETFIGSVKWLCLYAAEHEVDEWLKIDGKCLVDPHPEKNT